MTHTTSTHDAGRLSAPNIPSYADEQDPSWEEVIAMVVIPAQPGAIRNAAGAWEVLLGRIEHAGSLLDQLATGLQNWEGAAGETYRAHLAELSGRVRDLVVQHSPVVQHLHTAADNVDAALANTPIPDELVDEALHAREQFLATGVLNTRFHPGYFADVLFPGFLDKAGDILGILTFGLSDIASDWLRDFLSDGDDQAKAAYRTLTGQHTGTAVTLSNSVGFSARTVGAQDSGMTPITGTTQRPAYAPGTGTMPSIGGAGSGPTVDPNEWSHDTGTSLASAGGGGLGAVGAPSGGAGGLGGLGHVGGGLGASGGAGVASGAGGGAGGAAIRPGSTTSAASAIRGGMGGMPMMGGAGGGAGGAGTRTAGSRTAVPGVASKVAGGAAMGAGGGGKGGAAGGARGVGMAPMGGGAGGGGDSTDHSTWLQEDEDPWGTESDAPPPAVG